MLSGSLLLCCLTDDVWIKVVDRVLWRWQGGGGLDSGRFQLVAQFPRRVMLPTAQEYSLEDLGLTASQEALVVEPCEA